MEDGSGLLPITMIYHYCIFCMLNVYMLSEGICREGVCLQKVYLLFQASEHEQCLCVMWQEPQVEECTSICGQQSSWTLVEFPGIA